MASYMSVDKEEIQKAFALAHRAACDKSLDSETALRFKQIAATIWKACGESQTMPVNLPDKWYERALHV